MTARPAAERPATSPTPVTDDPDTGGLFDAADRGDLALCVCAECAATLHLPKDYCHVCGSRRVVWRTVSGRGALHSSTIVERQVHPDFPVPYTIVLVDVDLGADRTADPAVRLIGHLAGRHELEIGTLMEVWFEGRGIATVPNWRPVVAPGSAPQPDAITEKGSNT